MPQDTIWEMHCQGLSAREIAARIGKTRNAVIGHIWRYRKRSGPARFPRHVALSQAIDAVSSNDGCLTRAARDLGVSTKTLNRLGVYSELPKKVNLGKNPSTSALIVAIDASGLSDAFIAEEAGMGNNTIRNWRNGTCTARAFSIQCVRTVLEKNSPGY